MAQSHFFERTTGQFEKRLRIFFGLLIAFSAILLARSAYVQVIKADFWQKKAQDGMKRTTYIEPPRGRILDSKGRELAIDEPCIDAAVLFQVIERNPDWLKQTALNRLLKRAGAEYRRSPRPVRDQMIMEEIGRVSADIDALWKALALAGGKSIEEIEEIKGVIKRRVNMRRRVVWYRKYRQATKLHHQEEAQDEFWFNDWLLSGDDAPQLDSFEIDVAEQSEAHVILPNISPEIHIRLKKQIDQFPGLELRASKRRFYPFGSSAAHVIGTLAPVALDDLKAGPKDDLSRYYPNDLIGRFGVEAMSESFLRGRRGMIQRLVGRSEIVHSEEPVPGNDLRLTIDIELQRQIEESFRKVQFTENTPQGRVLLGPPHEMHGAAVIIEVASGDVLALVSAPQFDLNQYSEIYPDLVRDSLNFPLMNRATQLQREPGSTVKPIVGLAAITQGLLGAHDGIRCTGYMEVNGKPLPHARCWTASSFASRLNGLVADHPIPYDAPLLRPLTLRDAVQRSCNIYFQTLGERMGLEGLSEWYLKFGLGRKTEVGIEEWPGVLPRDYVGPKYGRRTASWYSAIGQSPVFATPIQMANVAATIARDGVWMRPRLVTDLKAAKPTTTPARVDLALSPDAIRQVREGMFAVVHQRGGTGTDIALKGIEIAGKTGSAQSARFSHWVEDADGKRTRAWPEINDERLGLHVQAPWYRGHDGKPMSHAWFIGFAPADRPTLAFAVMMEYGGSGGHDLAPIVQSLLKACVANGYLHAKDQSFASRP